MNTGELEGRKFACLEGCGFCCTFQPEVSTRELALLRKNFQPKPVPVAVGEGRTYLQLQNKCGACTLLSRRGCTAYDLRPAHCRYFPYHVHFADETEVYVNHACRGVELTANASLQGDFERSVMGVAKPDELREHERLARDTYAQFKRNARRANAWGDVDAVVAAALGHGAALFTAEFLSAEAERAGMESAADKLHEEAMAPFEAEQVTARPFYLAADLRWITFERREPERLAVLEMDEAGALLPAGEVTDMARWQDAPVTLGERLLPYFRHLTSRRLFAGSVYGVVDDEGYQVTVEEAARLRIVEVATDLVLRARILQQMDIADARLPDEVRRFYDSQFLDVPSIGGFL